MYLVTGGAGFFGEILVKKLLAAGHNVTCLDLNRPSFSHPNLRVCQGDIRDPNAVSEALNMVNLVYHNVAQVPVAKDIKLFWSVNYDGMKNILAASLEKK